MDILLTSATNLEIQPSIDFFRSGPPKLEILVTGVGATATTFELTDSINRKRPDVIIQAGIAGCFADKVPGDVVIIEEEIWGDMGVWENDTFKNIFDLKLADVNGAPFTNGMLINPYKKLLSLAGLERVRSVSVNEITTQPSRIRWYQQNLNPVVESMEGAAFHYTALKKQIPFLQIRSISNGIGERDKTKWHIKRSIETLNEKLIMFIKELYTRDETYFRI